jgi:hypothetical protein
MDPSRLIKDKLRSNDRLDNADKFVQVHHWLMKEYGWIPIDEFKKIPIPTLFGLISCINEDRENEKRENEKMKRKH